ncbi:DUF1853 family protein [Gelidibacter gilvus]|uniref:DUF1853 family protein n=1 Tax=Gelidibacter gilvus TaxID=59602 RepID=A0A4V1LN62_9FLAO|nr:DUF1853 family protein [Gelidibacter gilvus]RXJ51176.1 DUF1853 family protein [Gelidibacter gilvus]
MEKDNLQRNFEGYLNTPLLWHDAEVYGLKQCALKGMIFRNFTQKSNEHLRLGKLVEQFVFHQLDEDGSYSILAENIQIQDGKRTIGELDALLMTENRPVHLEIIYKFYLYDPSEGNTELSHWIGPNRRDSLLQKLDKLKEKQLPLLYHPKTQSLLDDLSLNLSEIKQQILFKAQLFLPLDHQKTVFSQLNPDCVKGFYLKINDLERFELGQFYIPEKVNWLMDIHEHVAWMDYHGFMMEIKQWTFKKLAPMCWLKLNGHYSKFFVVWW